VKRGLLGLLFALGLIVVSAPAVRANNAQTFLLIAGQHEVVGTVQVSTDQEHLYLTYLIDDATPLGWWISEVHVAVSTTLDGIPQKNGNPIPGKFPYPRPFIQDPWVQSLTVKIDIEDAWRGNPVTIAAHGVVQKLAGLDALELSLPGTATLSNVVYPFEGGPAYFPSMTVVSSYGMFNGNYPGWCVDLDHYIYERETYDVKVYSSYGTLPAGLVEHPENLDLVNWILNQNYVGKPAPDALPYTYGDVQMAIWTLVEDVAVPNNLGTWSQAHVDAILAAAQASGEGFRPVCGQDVAIILAPFDPQNPDEAVTAQVVLVTLRVPCGEESETAWAGVDLGNGNYGFGFPGKNWALYFIYNIPLNTPRGRR